MSLSNHPVLLYRTEWPERRRILSRRTADGDEGTVGPPGQQAQQQQQQGMAECWSPFRMAEIPALDATWDKAMCARVAGLTTIDLAVSWTGDLSTTHWTGDLSGTGDQQGEAAGRAKPV